MELYGNGDRKLLNRVLRSKKWEEAELLGPTIIKPASPGCCINYVLDRIGYPTRDKQINILRTMRLYHAQQKGIIVYLSAGERMHFGIYDGEKVTSKWNEGPVFEHQVAQVPEAYGNEARFTPINAGILIRLQSTLQGNLFDLM